MFVELGCTYDIHRAHMVRGILETHGVPAEVWHEAPLIGDFVPGWLGCSVVVPEDQFEAAVEILNARPEEIPEQDGAGEIAVPFRKHPTFLDWLIVGAGTLLLSGVTQALAMMPEHVEQAHTRSTLVEPEAAAIYLVFVVPVGGAVFAMLATLFLAPLKIWDGDRWMGMLAYLFVLLVLFAIPVLGSLAFRALPTG